MKQPTLCFLALLAVYSYASPVAPALSEPARGGDDDRMSSSIDPQHDVITPIPASSQGALDPAIIIYYGLNGSNSRSWVRERSDGVIGISCFQRFDGSYEEGTLLHKTIHPDGSRTTDSITTGVRLEKSVLLYDSFDNPHVFVAQSTDSDQTIDHHYRDGAGPWQSETIVHFNNEGGRFIYELSATTGPDHSFHLLILKTRSNIDSDDFMDAWINSYLYHMTNATGAWVRDLVHNYDMAYTYDMYIKCSSRQDIKVDTDGFVHVVFSEQTNGIPDPSHLRYATNKTGTWVVETALTNYYGSRDDAGWFPSLCLDNDGVPHVSCMYVNRVWTGSATYCKLFFLERLGSGNWPFEVVADHDDGYYASDGRTYTGGLTHLVFDSENNPHIAFSDIASAHWGWQGSQCLSVGNIRYAVQEDGIWNIGTIYRQPLPTGFLSATEMYGLCLIVSENTNKTHIIGQELVVTGEYQYSFDLVDFAWSGDPNDPDDDGLGSLMDNCPYVYNPGQEDGDADSVGTACDNCPTVYNPDQADNNSNDVGDACDCVCPCYGDPQCDAVTDVLDVIAAVNVAFRGAAALTDPLCPTEQTDVFCDGFTNVMDVVKFVNVAFRGRVAETEFCDPCAP